MSRSNQRVVDLTQALFLFSTTAKAGERSEEKKAKQALKQLEHEARQQKAKESHIQPAHSEAKAKPPVNQSAMSFKRGR